MSQKTKYLAIAGCFLIGTFMLTTALQAWREAEHPANMGVYQTLPAAPEYELPADAVSENHIIGSSFQSHLPLVVLEIDSPLPEYKAFPNEQEIVLEDQPYVTGSLQLFDGPDLNSVSQQPALTTDIQIKKRGHTSFDFAKPQYLIKSIQSKTPAEGEANQREVDMLGMGDSDSWILNGSLADKSLVRNYLAYSTASKIGGGGFAPDAKFCEVLIRTPQGIEYEGVYLLMETVQRNPNRVDLTKFKESERYTSYLVRRDRFTHYDMMLDTYGRLNGLSEQWIGLKYPSEAKITPAAKEYIESDFSKIEQTLYSDDENEYRVYDKYIDVDSFIDYFLVNDFFGNYDAGDHSTYMSKDSGSTLKIGPVWDFDQAMNNSFLTETDPLTLAFQTKPMFEQLCKDQAFVEKLKSRYAKLRQTDLSKEAINKRIDEALLWIGPAQQRDWKRWEQNYMDENRTVDGSYYLDDYVADSITVSRFNDEYNHEIYNLRTYLKLHGDAIQTELTKLKDSTVIDTQKSQYQNVFYVSILALLCVPALIIGRKG